MDYSRKPRRYFSSFRSDFLSALPDNPTGSILEIGCGTGELGEAAFQMGKCERYCGIEIDPVAAAEARTRISEVIEGDVETLPFTWQDESFNVLIASEVLEHLKDPWTTLRRLKQLLTPGAVVLASSPNVAHWRVVKMLLRGRWDLTETGVMDRTHLRWFTPATYCQLFESAGFDVQSCAPVRTLGWRGRLVQTLTLGSTSHLLWNQIAITAQRPMTDAQKDHMEE